MKQGLFNVFTVNGEQKSFNLNDIKFAFQRVQTGVFNDTVLLVSTGENRRLEQVKIDETYAEFLAKALNKFMDLTFLGPRDIEQPVAINASAVSNYLALGSSYTLVHTYPGRRFKINMTYAAFKTAYEGALDASMADFSSIPEYDTHEDAAVALENGFVYHLSEENPGEDPRAMFVVINHIQS